MRCCTARSKPRCFTSLPSHLPGPSPAYPPPPSQTHSQITINSKIVLALMPTCFSLCQVMICRSSSRAMPHLRLNGWRMPQVALVFALVIVGHHVHRPHLQHAKLWRIAKFGDRAWITGSAAWNRSRDLRSLKRSHVPFKGEHASVLQPCLVLQQPKN